MSEHVSVHEEGAKAVHVVLRVVVAVRALAVSVPVCVEETVVDAAGVNVALLVNELATDELLDDVEVGAGVEVISLDRVVLTLEDKVSTGVGVDDILSLLVPDLVPVSVRVD